jgi:hypothetical protein
MSNKKIVEIVLMFLSAKGIVLLVLATCKVIDGNNFILAIPEILISLVMLNALRD